MSPLTRLGRGSWLQNEPRQPPKSARIHPVIESNRELLQEGRQPERGSQVIEEDSLEQVYLEQLPFIGRAAVHACRRYGFGPEEIEDFTQHVKLKILADNYAVLRKYQGRSPLPNYLAMVVHRALQDYVNSRWGKWRTSAEARRLGPLACQLETLLVRDHLSLDETCKVLRTNRGVRESEDELRELAARLPAHLPRRVDRRGEMEAAAGGLSRRSGQHSQGEPAAAESADERLWNHERARRRKLARQALASALQALPSEDCLIAKMLGEFQVVEIARTLGLAQKPLYRRTEKILKTLRRKLEGAGISAADVEEMLDHADS